MPEIITVSLLMRSSEDLSHVEKIHTFFIQLAEQGHYLCGSDSEAVHTVWYAARNPSAPSIRISRANTIDIDPKSLYIPHVTQTLWDDVDKFLLQHTINELSVSVFSTQQAEPLASFHCDLTFYAQENQINVSMIDNSNSIEDYQHFLAVVQLVYETWHPIYGYQDDLYRGVSTSLEEARQLDITWIFDINLFSPEVMEHIGRERVLSTPAWQVKTLNDGGVLLVPALYRSGAPDETYRFHRDEVAQHLGLIDEIPDPEKE